MINKLRESLSIVIVGIVMIALFSSGLVLYIKKANNTEVKVEQPTEQPVKQTETTTTEETKPARIWKGIDYGLPAGVVVGGEYLEGMPSSNWISIQQADGHIVVVKNLEWQIHSAIEEGDIIE